MPMFDRREIRYTYLKLSKRIKDFLLSDKSREFLIFLFFHGIFSHVLPLKIHTVYDTMITKINISCRLDIQLLVRRNLFENTRIR